MLPQAFILLCALITVQAAHGLEVLPMELLVRNWTTHDELPENHIHAITRTRDGFLWIGTSGGLARFDGVHSRNYGLRDGLGGVVVRSLLESSDGTLWVGTLGGGLSAIRSGEIARTYTPADGLPSASVTHLLEDPSGRVWAGNGVGLVRLENDRFVPIPGAPGQGRFGVQAWYRARSGLLWIALWRNGLWCWKDEQWSRPEEGSPSSATAFCEDASGRLWIGQDDQNRLWSRDHDGWSSYTLPEGITGTYPCSLAAASDGTIWMARYDGGGVCGLRSDGQWVTPVPRSDISLDAIESIFATTGGQLWMGSYSKGLYALSPPRTTVVTLPGLGTNEFTALLEISTGEFLVGTKGRGWFCWRNGQAAKLCNQPDFSRYRYGNAAIRTRDGSIWLATNEGLHEFRDGHRVVRSTLDAHFSNLSVLAICENNEGGVWVGTSYGHLFRVRGDEAQKVSYGAKLQSIDVLTQEPDGTLWIGTRGDGLYRLRGTESRRYGRLDGLKSELVTSLYLDPDGVLWTGTIGGGLARRDGERFISITTEAGLPDDTVSQITADNEGRLWLGTNRGLAAVDRRELKRVDVVQKPDVYSLVANRFDGMLADECTKVPPVRMSDGRLAFATTCGFVILKPSDFQAATDPPAAVIDTVKINGHQIRPVAKTLTIPPGAERIEIHFTAVHLADPKQLRFLCRLNGLEREWNEVGIHRSVEYRNLTPGQYRFEVATSIGTGQRSAQTSAVEIVLAPSFWQTWWFRLVATVITAALVAASARWMERIRTRQRIRVLEQQHAIDTERARIARDLHDDVGATLTQVALLSELAQCDLVIQPERASEHINEIFTIAKAVTRSLDEIVWAINPAHDTLKSFAQFLGTFVQNYARAAGLQIRLELPEVSDDVPLTAPIRHHLFLATKETLHNTVKHAVATEIRLRLTFASHCLRLEISDNGCGFDTDVHLDGTGSDGLLNSEQRMKQIRGTYARRSAPGSGTTCEMEVPIPMAKDLSTSLSMLQSAC